MQKIFLKNNQKGFTLAEILISVVVVLMILTIVSSIFVLSQRVSRKSNTKAELIQNGRIVIDLMTREIRQGMDIVTTLPADTSNPDLVAHELLFEDGHNTDQIQYIKYYLDGNDLMRQIVVYYFDYAPTTYVRWHDNDQFGPPTAHVIDERIIGEFFSSIDFYGDNEINIDIVLEKNSEEIESHSEISPRNA